MSAYELWFAEHGILEWATVLALLGTILVAARLWWRRAAVSSEGLRPYLCVVVPLALVTGLDELSFGEDVVGYERPVLVGYDVGSVHDLLLPLMRTVRSALGLDYVAAVLVFLSAAIAVAVALAWALRRRLAALGRIVGAAHMRPAWLSLGCTLFLGALALVIDGAGPVVLPGWRAHLVAAEELLEVTAAVTLLAGSVWLQRHRTREAGQPAASGLRPGSLRRTAPSARRAVDRPAGPPALPRRRR